MSFIERALEKARSSTADDRAPQPLKYSLPARGTSDASVRPQPQFTVSITETRLRDSGYLAPVDQAQHIGTQFQHLKRALLASIREPAASSLGDPRLIMMTSSVAGEGKTFNSLNLALSLAQERDHEVLLLDADFTRRKLSELFGVTERRGFLDAAKDESLELADLIVGTPLRGLQMLPAGQPDDNATEYLSSERTRQLLTQLLLDPRRIILLDCAPLLQTSETNALVHLMGQILLVVRAGVSPRAAVRDALASLNRREGVGLLLNGEVPNRLQDYLYGYKKSYTYAQADSSEDRG